MDVNPVLTSGYLRADQAIPNVRRGGRAETQQWRSAKRWILGNALFYLLFSLLAWGAEVRTFPVLLAISACYSLGGILGFVKLMLLGYILNPIAWYQLGTSIYFGAGAVIGALYQDTAVYTSQGQVIDDLLRANLLNSASILVVLGVAIASFEHVRRLCWVDKPEGDRLARLLLKYYNTLVYICLFAVGISLYYFPIPEDLLVRSFVGYGVQISQAFMLFIGFLWPHLRRMQLIGGVICFALLVAHGILSFSKLAATLPWLFLCVGYWMRKGSRKTISIGALCLIAYYLIVADVLTTARDSRDYDSGTNNLSGRIAILFDSAEEVFTADAYNQSGERSDEWGVSSKYSRFSVLYIQGFLIGQYERNMPGNTIDDFWAALIPRAVWPDKPKITRFGGKLDGLFWGRSGDSSALAPSYTGEAYWNYGPTGLLVVSLLLGLEVGWLARHAHLAKLGLDPAYYVISLQAIQMMMSVENWIAASYIGGFATLVVIYNIAKLTIRVFFSRSLLKSG